MWWNIFRLLAEKMILSPPKVEEMGKIVL